MLQKLGVIMSKQICAYEVNSVRNNVNIIFNVVAYCLETCVIVSF